jgi:hypothetical protein
MTDDHDFVMAFGLTICALCLGVLIGRCVYKRDFRQEAVEAGAAEWVATPDGDVEFRWKDQEQQK